MKKGILALAVATALIGAAGAQNLGTTSIADGFDTGTRGNEAPGTTPTDGSVFLDYSGADATGTIRYMNAYAGSASPGDAANGETPVLDVSAVSNPDRATLFSALTNPITVPANSLSGVSDGSKVLVVSDDGGHNTLVFGDEASDNYYVEIDFFAPDRSAMTTSKYEAVKIAIRTNRNSDPHTGGSWDVDRHPGYGVIYDYQARDFKAVKFQDIGSVSTTYGRAGAPTEFAEQYGSTVTNVASGWHRVRIEADGATVNFYLDGSQIATTTDASPLTNGRAAIQYRAGGSTTAPGSADESAGVFDNLKAGPFSASAVESWSLYQY